MVQELIYTSAPRGLFPGTSGYCTVGMTEGMPRPLIELLEGLSNTFRPARGGAAGGPPSVSFTKARVGGRSYWILTRNAECSSDFTGRSNNLAHHLVFTADELIALGNPAAFAGTPGLFLTAWSGEPRLLPTRRLPRLEHTGAPTGGWERVAGDDGWAQVVAEAWDTGADPLYVMYKPGVDPLPLIAEAVGQVSPDRWADVTFDTHYCGSHGGVACAVRCVPVGGHLEAAARRTRHLDLATLRGRRATRKAPARAVAEAPNDQHLELGATHPPTGRRNIERWAVPPVPTADETQGNELTNGSESAPAKSFNLALLIMLLMSIFVNCLVVSILFIVINSRSSEVDTERTKTTSIKEVSTQGEVAAKQNERDNDKTSNLEQMSRPNQNPSIEGTGQTEGGKVNSFIAVGGGAIFLHISTSYNDRMNRLPKPKPHGAQADPLPQNPPGPVPNPAPAPIK